MSKARELAELGAVYDSGALSNRNMIINGDMRFAQRGTSFTVTNEYGLDRWFCRENTDGALTFSQDSESPDGFSKSLKVNVDTADSSLGSSQFSYLGQRMEGFTIERLGFGGSGAKKVTLSFYVRCSVTGKFGGAMVNGSNNNRSFAFTYDVNSANTWERKTITIDGDTTGTWNIDNTQEAVLYWSLGGGSSVKKAEGSWDATAGVQSATEATTELIENASATWFLTGVQLELGTEATPFEHRSFGDELMRCYRYYFQSSKYNTSDTSTAADCIKYFSYVKSASAWEWHQSSLPSNMRAAPTVTTHDGTTAGKISHFTSNAGASTNNHGPYGVSAKKEYFFVHVYSEGSIYGFSYNFKADAEL